MLKDVFFSLTLSLSAVTRFIQHFLARILCCFVVLEEGCFLMLSRIEPTSATSEAAPLVQGVVLELDFPFFLFNFYLPAFQRAGSSIENDEENARETACRNIRRENYKSKRQIKSKCLMMRTDGCVPKRNGRRFYHLRRRREGLLVEKRCPESNWRKPCCVGPFRQKDLRKALESLRLRSFVGREFHADLTAGLWRKVLQTVCVCICVCVCVYVSTHTRHYAATFIHTRAYRRLFPAGFGQINNLQRLK